MILSGNRIPLSAIMRRESRAKIRAAARKAMRRMSRPNCLGWRLPSEAEEPLLAQARILLRFGHGLCRRRVGDRGESRNHTLRRESCRHFGADAQLRLQRERTAMQIDQAFRDW